MEVLAACLVDSQLDSTSCGVVWFGCRPSTRHQPCTLSITQSSSALLYVYRPRRPVMSQIYMLYVLSIRAVVAVFSSQGFLIRIYWSKVFFFAACCNNPHSRLIMYLDQLRRWPPATTVPQNWWEGESMGKISQQGTLLLPTLLLVLMYIDTTSSNKVLTSPVVDIVTSP